MPNKAIYLKDLGLQDYQEVWELQQAYFDEILLQKKENRSRSDRDLPETPTNNYLFLVEHPPVYTLGKNGDLKNLLVSQEELSAKGVTFYKINRGGDITYHGPGQVVGYPILDLENFFTDIYKYLRLLEEMVILTLAEYGIKGERSKGETGVWLDAGTSSARKICAMGVRASRWVTMHGFAFNVNTNLSYFENIVPCGIKDKAVTSLRAELREKEVNIEEVKQKLLKHFVNLMKARFIKYYENKNNTLQK